MTPAIHANKVRCRFCSRWCSPFEVIGAGNRGYTCLACIEWHIEELQRLGVTAPAACQECGASWPTLKVLAGGTDVRMYAVPKDGIYQLLCARCKDRYVPKRIDLYGDTEYGAKLKLK